MVANVVLEGFSTHEWKIFFWKEGADMEEEWGKEKYGFNINIRVKI